MRRIVLGLAIIAALTLIGSAQTASASHPKVTIAVGSFFFCDPELEIGEVCKTDVAAGTTVIWDFLPGIHTTTECGSDPCGTVAPPMPLWDSGQLTSGTFAYTFTTPGVYNYFCTRHPIFMLGQINVGPAGPAVGGVAEVDAAAGARLDASEPYTGTSSFATAIAIATAVTLVAGLIGAAWYARRRQRR